MFDLVPLVLLLEISLHVGVSFADVTFDAAHPMITQRADLFVREAPLSLVGYYTVEDENGKEWSKSIFHRQLPRTG